MCKQPTTNSKKKSSSEETSSEEDDDSSDEEEEKPSRTPKKKVSVYAPQQNYFLQYFFSLFCMCFGINLLNWTAVYDFLVTIIGSLIEFILDTGYRCRNDWCCNSKDCEYFCDTGLICLYFLTAFEEKS